jgi:hypothetical protein
MAGKKKNKNPSKAAKRDQMTSKYCTQPHRAPVIEGSAELGIDDEVALASILWVTAENKAVEFTQPFETLATSKPLHRPTDFECSQPSRWLVVNGSQCRVVPKLLEGRARKKSGSGIWRL